MLNKLYITYAKFILRLDNVPKYWIYLRFILHWLTIPLKLVVIGSLGMYQIIYQTLFFKTRKTEQVDSQKKAKYFKMMLQKLPIFRDVNSELYVNRVPYYERPNGTNHNIDHQCLRQGTYTFLMGKIDRRNAAQEISLSKHMKNGILLRGYNSNGDENKATVSGDMLCGMSLAMLDVKSGAIEGVIAKGTTGDTLRDKFDEVVNSIIENDFALLEGTQPEDGPERSVWDDELKLVKDSTLIRMKSARGMWQPGLETAGAQALTLLAAVRIADKKCGSLVPKRVYSKLLWRYGYGLLSLFPTAFIQSKRGYYNEHNCMNSAYILAKLADSKLGKLFWTLPMIYMFLLSYKWRNGYFTGLLLDVAPYFTRLLSYHKQECINNLYELEPIPYSREHGIEIPVTKDLPVPFSLMNQGEFHVEQVPKLLITKVDDEIIRTDNCHSGLGFIAHAIMLEPNTIKEILNESK